ncbi:MAG TPA: type II CRISPR-associated endonuclease Cas1 [Geminicoccaceae bacterium]|nr:type II CRISPR-associated endonuclease Cas1 [Geminicoccus sp.]HMU49533.1 type II CRISPR-associated endonuclease Cas1 [Geminicoccaceae bacterium]
MAWRGVHVSQRCRLSLDNGCCLVETEAGPIRLAFEDIAYVVLDTPQVGLTSAVLAALAEAKVLVLVSDARHLPTGALLPLQGHFRQVGTLRRQIAAADGLKRRLWQALVRAKLVNQGAVLDTLGRRSGPALSAMAERVASGDPENLEGQAAREYFSRLFEGFRRRRDGDVRNAMMNYGYAIVRAAIARDLAAQGFHPALGLWHDSVENAFNLADDLIEPLRPVVDLAVVRRLEARDPDDGEELTIDDRRSLAGVLTLDVALGGECLAMMHAIERMCDGLLAALTSKSPERLPLPGLRA